MDIESVDMRAGLSVVQMMDILRDRRSPLQKCLDLWVRWQQRDDSGIGWRGAAALLESDSSASSEQLYDRMDNRTGEAVDAMVNSLSAQHAWAICKRCSVTNQWKFAQLDYPHVLQRAEDELIKKLKINIATRNYF